MKVPLLDLKAQYATIREEVLAAVTEVLDSQVCIGGPKVTDLEQKIAAISDCKYGIGVSSGTDALLCSLMSLDIGPGDEVITTPFTFFATAGSIARTGATPVFVDIDPRTYNIDPDLIHLAITKRTKAIMPVHLFGQMCDMDPIVAVANEYGLHVIEDAAQSIAAIYKHRRSGSIGTCGCFSFFPSKNLGAAGDAGMVVTSNEELYQRMTSMRNHGARPKYYHKYIGGNFRLDPIQASILSVKLRHLESWSQARRDNACHYERLFSGSPVVTPYIRPDCTSTFNQYVIQLDNRQDVQNYLKTNGIQTEIYYPLPLHLQDCFEPMVPRGLRLPVAEHAAKCVLALPVYPELELDMIEHTARMTLDACSGARPASL